MKEIKLLLDWLDGPILADRDEKGRYSTGIKVIDEDPICQKLDQEIYKLYDSEIVYDSDDIPRSTNEEKKNQDKAQMLNLINSLKQRLNNINDGTFVIIDEISDEYK